MKTLYSILMATLLVMILTACGESEVQGVDNASSEGNNGAEATETDNADGEEPSEEESVEAEDKVYGTGKTVSIDGMEITIDRASCGEQGEYTPAENGNVLRLEVSFHNASAESGFIDDTEFECL
ncbi:hypothetical protein ACFQ3N_19075 [Virgibacillus byunsanensis]|uniref:Lipoprotein n=1 Tax=Virgibacillus byunsanensis TaxID=570945 RepID=A0ABW3LRN6_9BACI